MKISRSPRSMILRHLAALLALGFLTTMVYSPGLPGAFILDDTSNIVDKPQVHLDSLSAEALADAATAYDNGPLYRPISTLTLAFDYWFWDGEPFGFKLTNLLLHALTASLIFFLALGLWKRLVISARPDKAFWSALAVAAIWAVHPLQVSTVLYAVQRMEILAALFIVASLLAYMAARVRLEYGERGAGLHLGVAGLLTLLALLSKETGALAPVFMLVIEILVFRFRAARGKVVLGLKCGFAVLLVVMAGLYLGWLVPEYFTESSYAHRAFSLEQRLLTQLRVLPIYIGWILLPATDNYLFYYDHFAHSTSILNPLSTLGGGVLLAVLVVVAWRLRKRMPLFSLGIAGFFVSHALTSNVIPLELIFEHRNYLGMFFILIAVTDAASRVFRRFSPSLPVVITVTVVLGLSLLTVLRSATWGDEMNLALHHVAVNPESERAGLDLAELYLEYSDGYPGSPFMRMASARFERVAGLPNSRLTADQALILMAVDDGGIDVEQAWDRLVRKAAQSALDAPDYDALYNLVQRAYQGWPLSHDRLWQLYLALCERRDIPADIYMRFGYYAALTLEDERKAAAAFKRALTSLADRPARQIALRSAISEAGIALREGVEPCPATER